MEEIVKKRKFSLEDDFMNNYYLVYMLRDDTYDIYNYYELDDIRSREYNILYEGDYEACNIYLGLV